MKILTVVGTRSEMIRMSMISSALDSCCNHFILHTGFEEITYEDFFFEETGIRRPNRLLDTKADTFAERLSNMIAGVNEVIDAVKPDRILMIGDTMSALTSIVSEEKGIPVYHMNSGVRYTDTYVAGDRTRKIVDATVSVRFPYTELNRQNLLSENIPTDKIFVTGNPFFEVVKEFQHKIDKSTVLSKLGITAGRYVIATVEHPEIVDNIEQLTNIVNALEIVSRECQVVFIENLAVSRQMEAANLSFTGVKVVAYPGFVDFTHLEQHSHIAITDSSDVQEEMFMFRKPTVSIRTATDRPETIVCGANMIAGTDVNTVAHAYRKMSRVNRNWAFPTEYTTVNVADIVSSIMLSK